MNPAHDHDESDPEQPGLLASMWRYRLMSVFIVFACVVLSVGAGLYLAPAATATATIALKTPMANNVLSPGATGDATLARYTAQRARFVTSDAVITAVAEEFGRSDLESVRGNVSATPSGTSNILTVEVTGDSPEEAVDLAAATVSSYRSETRNQVDTLTTDAIESIDASAEAIRQDLSGSPSGSEESSAAVTLGQLQLQASEIQTNSALLGDGVEFVVAPRLDSVVVPGLPLREGALGVIVGLVVAATISWLRADRALQAAGSRAAAGSDDEDPLPGGEDGVEPEGVDIDDAGRDAHNPDDADNVDSDADRDTGRDAGSAAGRSRLSVGRRDPASDEVRPRRSLPGRVSATPGAPGRR